MGIFTRFTDIINSNINAILDKAEDPQKLVRLMIQEMEATLVEVRSAAARAIADEKDIQRQLARLNEEVADWVAKAELAVSKGREDLAKAALAEKARVMAVIESLDRDRDAVEHGVAQLAEDIAKLEDKLADAKARQKALLTRHATSSNRLEVRKRIHDYRVDDALNRFDHFESRINTIDGEVEAYDLGAKGDLRSQFRGLEDEENIDRELEEIKARAARQSDDEKKD